MNIDITKIYTKIMHKALQNALRNNFRIDYQPQGNFIRFLYNTRQGVTFKFNTNLPCVSGITSDSFLNMNYDSMINNLKEIYNKTQVNNLYSLKSV